MSSGSESDNFASNAISSSLSLSFLPVSHVGLIVNTQTHVTRSCHVTFWPRNSNAIFQGKIAQLCTLIKSTILIVGISNFGIVHFKPYIFKLCPKQISLHWHFNGNKSSYFDARLTNYRLSSQEKGALIQCYVFFFPFDFEMSNAKVRHYNTLLWIL